MIELLMKIMSVCFIILSGLVIWLKNKRKKLQILSLFWIVMHQLFSLLPEDFDETNGEPIKKFINSLSTELPCAICRKHWLQYLTNNPLTIINKTSTILWLFNAHNSVSITNNKKPLSINKITNLYGSNSIVSKYLDDNFNINVNNYIENNYENLENLASDLKHVFNIINHQLFFNF